MSTRSVILIAGNRQLTGGSLLVGGFLVVWGAFFGGIPLALMLTSSRGGPPLIFVVLGALAFFGGLLLLLRRREVRFDAARRMLEHTRSLLGFDTAERLPLAWFDRVRLEARRGSKGGLTYALALHGPRDRHLSLGEDLREHGEAVQAGLRAASVTGLPLDEVEADGDVVRLRPEQIAELAARLRAREEEEAASPWWRRPSALALIAANLVPLAGVLWWDWEILPLMALFWFENLIVGAYTVARMALARREGAARFAMIPFFIFHFGGFCAVHGTFVFALFGPRGARGGPDALTENAAGLILGSTGVMAAVLALVVSHGVSFVTNYLRPRAYEVSEARALMLAPYKRIVALHLVIIFGGMLSAGLGAPVVALALLTLAKIGIDLGAHLAEHRAPIVQEYSRLAESAGVAVLPAPAQPAAPVERQDINDKPLSHYLGTWRLAPGDSAPPGWFKEIVFGQANNKLTVRLVSQPGAQAADKLVSAQVRGAAARIEWIEVKLAGAGRERVLRFTAPGTGGERIELHEIQHPAGKPQAMQARSFALSRA